MDKIAAFIEACEQLGTQGMRDPGASLKLEFQDNTSEITVYIPLEEFKTLYNQNRIA